MASKGVWLILLLSWIACFEAKDCEMRLHCPFPWISMSDGCYSYNKAMGNWSKVKLECQSFRNRSHVDSVLNELKVDGADYGKKNSALIFKCYKQKIPGWELPYESRNKQIYRITHITDKMRQCDELISRNNALAKNEIDCKHLEYFLCKY